MRRRLGLALYLLVAARCAAFAAPPPASVEISVGQFVSTLRQLEAGLAHLEQDPAGAPVLLTKIPDAWHVRAESQSFEVPAAWVRDELGEFAEKHELSTLADMRLRIAALRAEAETYGAAPADRGAAKSYLRDILARREFAEVRGETTFDRLRARIRNWIIRVLLGSLGSSSFSNISRYLVYALVLFAVLALAYWTWKRMVEDSRFDGLLPGGVPVSAKRWRVWLEEARAAAERGLLRDAVHLAYWAGISYLEEHGAWRPDQARTPREYLRLLPTGSQHHATLAALTRQFEVTWYGAQAADSESFERVLGELEKLGCQ